MKLSKDFYLYEFERSQTASRYGINNSVEDDEILDALKELTKHVLQPIRNHFRRAVNVSSGYRSPELNKLIKGSPNSQHMKGQAADIEIWNIPNVELGRYIRDNLEFDQLILEQYDPNEGANSGWIHVSYKSPGQNRKEVLTIKSKKSGGGVFRGFI